MYDNKKSKGKIFIIFGTFWHFLRAYNEPCYYISLLHVVLSACALECCNVDALKHVILTNTDVDTIFVTLAAVSVSLHASLPIVLKEPPYLSSTGYVCAWAVTLRRCRCAC